MYEKSEIKIKELCEESFDNEVVVVRNNHNVTRFKDENGNTKSYNGFIHEIVYEVDGEETNVRVSKYDGELPYKTQFIKENENAVEVGRIAKYNERGIFNELCRFKCDDIEFDGKQIICDDTFTYNTNMFNEYTDVWIINGEPISLFDGEYYDVETHNANLNRVGESKKARADEINKDDTLTDAEKVQKLMALI